MSVTRLRSSRCIPAARRRRTPPARRRQVSMKRPVFVVGCPRSGTTLLYSLLVAAGGFAFYRKETYFFDVVRRFSSWSTPEARRRLVEAFLQGYLGKVPGLDVVPLVRQAAAGANPHEFLPRLMTAITQTQGMTRWIE